MLRCLSTMYFVAILSGNILDILTEAEPLIGHKVTAVEKGKYPFLVSIKHRPNRFSDEEKPQEKHFCTGTLITKNFVLTAAHCFRVKLTGAIRNTMESIDQLENDTYDTSMWITYDQWADSKNITKTKGSNDIAILKLSREVSSPGITPASLSYVETRDMHFEYVTLVGWGISHVNSTNPSRYMNEAQVKVLSNAVCENISYFVFNKERAFPDKYLCTRGYPYVIVGKGDSGGPVLRNGSVVAVSRGTCPKSGECDLPQEILNKNSLNIHTGLRPYREFINDVLENY